MAAYGLSDTRDAFPEALAKLTLAHSGNPQGVLRRMANRWHRWLDYRLEIARVTRELQQHTDRELNDLGLGRGDIPAVARGIYRRY
jgi:uncharacterized protein YjiS (DUF1127 family)